MSEISKLRQRLNNVHRNVTEYRMTVVEARELLSEIDSLVAKKVKEEVTPVVSISEPITIVKVIDGGSF